MSTTIKTEGFQIPGSDHSAHRPSLHRPFSDGSMTVETEFLASLMSGAQPHHSISSASPFAFSSSLPIQNHTFDYGMTSPMTGSVDRFHPAAIFTAMKFGHDNPEPPVNLPESQRSRSQSSSRSSHIGKAPSSRSRSSRKSMNDVRPAPGTIQPRGRSTQVGRAHSFSGQAARGSSQTGAKMSLGIGLDTHVEGEQTDSISPPDYGLPGSFAMTIGQNDQDGASWGSSSIPSMLPGSLGSFGEADDPIVDSPITPVRPLNNLVDDSFKKQRRRECHNQVEKRRREHINAKIEELSSLLPPLYNAADNDEALDDEEEEDVKPQQGASGKKKKSKRASSTAKAQKDAAQCKGRILTMSVQYIRDLKHVTDIQAGRIAQLESMLMTYGVNPAVQAPNTTSNQPNLFWLDSNNTTGGSSNALSAQQTLELMQGHNLEVMRPSPEPERPFSFEHVNLDNRASWSAAPTHEQTNGIAHSAVDHNLAADVLMSFEPSPETNSSGMSNNNLRRSSESVSSNGSFDGELHDLGDMQSPMGLGMNTSDVRGRQRQRTVRKDSQIELQMSMSSLLSGRGDDDLGGMRW
ncbi:hypothetical protein IAU60_001820 [Kwoniella sp. DSM 27419]